MFMMLVIVQIQRDAYFWTCTLANKTGTHSWLIGHDGDFYYYAMYAYAIYGAI